MPGISAFHPFILMFLVAVLFSCREAPRQPLPEAGLLDETFEPDIDIELYARATQMQLMDGNPTDVYTYEASLIEGSAAVLQEMEGRYPGPVIRVQQGDKVRVRFHNELPGQSIIHWHGLHLSPEMDGHPRYAIGQGETFVYEFTINNPPGTYWFHPHPEGHTGEQVYRGLAGLLIVEDEEGRLPTGDYDLPLLIQDRSFDDDNRLVYHDDHPMMQMHGFLGDRILVNGRLNKIQEVDRATYRLRVLNGSNSRIYKLAWSDGSPVIVTATDGGLLQSPVELPYLMLAPGERFEIWKDFSEHAAGENITLESLEFLDGMLHVMEMDHHMMDEGMMGDARQMPARMRELFAVAQGASLDIMTFSVGNQDGPVPELPGQLGGISGMDPATAINRDDPRQFFFYHEHMDALINGESFVLDEVAEWERVAFNTTEVWQFINDHEVQRHGMTQQPMQMPHPVHIHGVSFQIINRDVSAMDPDVWDSVHEGFVDQGWHDTFLLLPGMKVNVLIRFEHYSGVYLYHCHNLEHHDMGMMRNYEIVEAE